MPKTQEDFEKLRTVKSRVRGNLFAVIDFGGDRHQAAETAETIRLLPALGTGLLDRMLRRASITVSPVRIGNMQEPSMRGDQSLATSLEDSRSALISALRPYAGFLGNTGRHSVEGGQHLVIDINQLNKDNQLPENEVILRLPGCNERNVHVVIIPGLPYRATRQLWIPRPDTVQPDTVQPGAVFEYRGGSIPKSQPVWEPVAPIRR